MTERHDPECEENDNLASDIRHTMGRTVSSMLRWCRTPALRVPRGLALAAGLVLLAPARVRAQFPADTALYTVNNSTTLSVVTNRTTGTTAAIATLSFATSALARDPVTRRIYYMATNAATPVGRVAYYDPATGTNTIINNVGS